MEPKTSRFHWKGRSVKYSFDVASTFRFVCILPRAPIRRRTGLGVSAGNTEASRLILSQNCLFPVERPLIKQGKFDDGSSTQGSARTKCPNGTRPLNCDQAEACFRLLPTRCQPSNLHTWLDSPLVVSLLTYSHPIRHSRRNSKRVLYRFPERKAYCARQSFPFPLKIPSRRCSVSPRHVNVLAHPMRSEGCALGPEFCPDSATESLRARSALL